MTAEPDALRLVPVEPTPEMVRAMCVAVEDTVLLESDDPQFVDAYDFWLPPVREAWAKALAAAPAVQPAAGREEIARIVLDAVFEGFEHGECEKEWEPDYGRELAAKATSRILADLAHPPAQGSESGPTCQKCGGEIHGWCCQSCDAEFRENDAGNLVFDDDTVLSQPGPASEGEAR